jgi:hypothetical protein
MKEMGHDKPIRQNLTVAPIVKFLFDVGLLNPMLGCSHKEIKQQSYGFLSMKKAATLLRF